MKFTFRLDLIDSAVVQIAQIKNLHVLQREAEEKDFLVRLERKRLRGMWPKVITKTVNKVHMTKLKWSTTSSAVTE